MNVTLLLAQCTSEHLVQSTKVVIKVLEELDVCIHKVDVLKLPYFNGKRTREMDSVVKSISESSGVIAITNVPMLSMHAAMQSFYDLATLYEEESFNKPMMAITYSEWLGEVESAQCMLKSWNVLGGIEGNKVCINKEMDLQALSNRLEREVEDFYRLMKQERQNIGCSERQIYKFIKSGNSFMNESEFRTISTQKLREEIKEETGPEIRSFVELLKQDPKIETPKQASIRQEMPKQVTVKQETPEPSKGQHINLSTKEQTIKEIANLLGREVEASTEETSGVYTNPVVKASQINKRIDKLPHYFIAQHDKTLKLIVKYQITDSNETGYILIKDGDCQYQENIDLQPTVEVILNQEVFSEVIAKKITYQKAFMLGKLKIKGNFAVLPKLDQIFKAV